MDIAYDSSTMPWRTAARNGLIALVLCLAFLMAAQSTSRTSVFDWIAFYGAKVSPYLAVGGILLVLVVWVVNKRR
jgi:hypothetical protein